MSILVDFSNVLIGCFTAEALHPTEGVTMNEDIARHMVMNTLRSINVKNRGTYGEMIIAIDSRNYWRRDIHPNYKGTRKKARSKINVDWELVHRCMDKFSEEIRDNLPFTVVKVERTEADDIIGVLTKFISENRVDKNSLFEEAEKVLIVSSDTDNYQLHKFKNVFQFSPLFDKKIRPEGNPTVALNLKIVTGDSGDCIPNIKSHIDDLVNEIRQKPIKQAEKDSWSRDISLIPETFLERFKVNQRLIDYEHIPQNYQDAILKEYEERRKNKVTMTEMYSYFLSAGLMNLMSVIDEFENKA
jgi:hypothetical protein